jgi:glutamyl-tRNA reductase
MHFSVVGINHRITPITIREKAAINSEKLYDSLASLHFHIPQGIILSTCNRTEVYTTDTDGHHGEEASINFLKAHLDIPDIDLLQYVYAIRDEAAIEHLFRVACGLDSMVVGEFEILGQVGQALELAEKAEMVNLPLRRVFQSAIRAGRRVRGETGISKNALSTSSVAVDLATRAVGDFQNCKILVIGAGDAGKLVVKAAKDRGASQIVVASRTRGRASTLAKELGVISIDLSRVVEELSTYDVVVTCAGAPRRILDLHRVATTMKTRQSRLVVIDIAVPRNVEPAVGQINNVILYNIDDLTQISKLNRKQREAEMQKAKDIIAAEVNKLASWWQTLKVRPVVSALMTKTEDIRCTQLDKTLKKLPQLSDEERDSLEAMTKSIVTRILKEPIQYLKANVNTDRDYAEIVSELFRLNGEKQM